MATRAGIDFEAINREVDLKALIEAELGPPLRNGRWACGIHHGDGPNLGVYLDGQRWRWKCHVCNAGGDAVDFVRAMNPGSSYAEAARMLTGELPPAHRPRPRVERLAGPESRRSAWQDPDWQAAAAPIVCEAEAILWDRENPESLRARQWLYRRKLKPETLRRFRIGFLPLGWRTSPLEVLADRNGNPRHGRLPRGIVIPHVRAGSYYSEHAPPDCDPELRWRGINCRQLMDDMDELIPDHLPKYVKLSGSTGGVYPLPDLELTQGMPPALIVEGEFDALLAEQEVGHLAYVLTTGGAGSKPDGDAIASLSGCPWWLLALDMDRRGIEAALTWDEIAPDRCRRLYLPSGKDITEYVQSQGERSAGVLQAWLRSEVAEIQAAMAEA